MNTLLDAALAFSDTGCSVVPAMADGSKAPAGKWQRWQAERPDAAQVTQWLGNGTYDGFGLVCGQVSGGLEMLEVEGRAVSRGLHKAYAEALGDHGLGDLWQRVAAGYAESTPSGGLHFLYRVDGTARGNKRLAVAADGNVLIETRGEGGFTIVAPSGGRTHPTGKQWRLGSGAPASIATITEDERDALWAVASLLTEAPVQAAPVPLAASGSHAGDRPGDDYNSRASWQDILTPHGWQCARAFGPGAYGWRRPGKETPGISATTRETGGLFVFSSSTPFDTETPYSKFAAYALLNHGGDHSAAAAQLRREGYGAPREHADDSISDLIAPAAASQPAILAGPHVVSLADVQAEHIEWLWDGYLPLGKVVVLDGDPGVGKSTVSIDIAARTSTGSPMPDGSAGVKGAVLLLSAEDGLADTIRPRLDAAGADPARVITITEMTDATADGSLSRPVTIPGDLPAIERVIAGHDVRLVVVDVLMAYLSGDVNAHRDQDIRRALHILSSVAERTRCCVIVLRHLNKSGGGNAVYRGGGSIGIIGAARAGFMCGRDPDDETGTLRVFANIKMNIAAEPPALGYRLVPDELLGCGRIEWLGQSGYRAGDLLIEPGRDEDRTERDEAADWLTGYLTDAGGEAARKDIFKDGRAAGFKDATLKRAKDKARIAHRSEGFPRQTVWALPVGSPDTQQNNGEPTELPEPTGSDLRKQDAESLQSVQSAQSSQYLEPELTGLCAVCREPLDRALIAAGLAEHPTCEAVSADG